MKKCISSIVLGLLVITGLVSCTPPQHIKELWNNKYKPINTLPMYGAPLIEKTEAQKKADEQFIKTVIKNSGSRENGAIAFAAWGWEARRNGKINNAMRQFNQSWLLDQNYYQPYWGFGVIALVKNKPSEAIIHFEKALKLIDDKKEKPRLLVDAARSYAWEGHAIKPSNSMKAEELLNKAVSLIDEALKLVYCPIISFT